MLLELIKSYRLRIEELKKQGLQGERAFLLATNLQDKSKFNTVDINELLDLLKVSQYETFPLNKVGTTIDYIRRNNLFEKDEYKPLLTSVISSLKKLKIEGFNQDEIDKLLNRIGKLEKSIEAKDLFITDFPLINRIIKESNLAPIDIYNIMLEIDNLNKKTLGVDNLDKHTLVIKLLNKYGYKSNLTEYEESLLETINISELEEKLEFIKGINEYEFLYNPLEHHRITTILLAPLKNIKNIYELAMNSNLSLDSIFGIFYFSKDYKLPDVNTPKDYYYQLFEGAYETFINNSRLLLAMQCDLKEAYENSSALFYMPTRKLETNKVTLDTYNIPTSIPNVLTSCEDDNTSLETQIDKFIEVGLYDYIKKYPQTLLNKDKALFHRIYYARKNNLPIKKKYLLRTITSINGYSINEENYQDKVETYNNPLFVNNFYQENTEDIDISSILNVLDTNYLKEDNVYMIENTYISRNKVIRLLKRFINGNNNMEILLYSILNGVLLDKETFDKIARDVLDKSLENNLTNIDEVNDTLLKLNINSIGKVNRI